jgi:hypothetical protein
MMTELSRSIYKYLSIAAIISIGLGIAATAVVSNNSSGYVAGFTWLYFLVLIAIASLILFVLGLILLSAKTQLGVSLILSSILLGGSYLVSSFVVKKFGLARYSNEQMTPIIPEVSNLVVFKKDATHEQIENFWAIPLSRPGVSGVGRNPAIQGYENISFSFFSNATEAQREDVIQAVKSSPIVYKLMENVSTSQVDKVDDSLPLPIKSIEQSGKTKSITVTDSTNR